MRDIFSGYMTGDRQWTFESQTFTEAEFRDLFEQVLPNEILHAAAAAYLYRAHLTVLRFSVPMQRYPANLSRDVYFIEVPESQYCDMYSCVYFNTSLHTTMIREHYERAQIGLMTEYEMLDLIEPTNERHQRALIDTWFDIDNWFAILSSQQNMEDNLRIDNVLVNIVNGYDPERQPDPIVDEFNPEFGAMNMNHMNREDQEDQVDDAGHAGAGAADAYWNVQHLLEPWNNGVNNIIIPIIPENHDEGFYNEEVDVANLVDVRVV